MKLNVTGEGRTLITEGEPLLCANCKQKKSNWFFNSYDKKIYCKDCVHNGKAPVAEGFMFWLVDKIEEVKK